MSTTAKDDELLQQQQQYFVRVTDLLIERSQLPANQRSAESAIVHRHGLTVLFFFFFLTDDEDDALLTKNSLTAFLRNPVALAQNEECGKRIELLLQYASAAQLRLVADAVEGKLSALAEHHAASFVVQTLLVCMARAIAADGDAAAAAADVAALRRFAVGVASEFGSRIEAFVSNRYAPHVVATALRLLAGAPLSADHVQFVRPPPVPGGDALGRWRGTPQECIGAVRGVVNAFVALDDDAFGRLVTQQIQTSIVLNALLEVASGESVRNVWGKPLWLALVDKARVCNERADSPLMTTGAGSLLFEAILKTSVDSATYESVFQRSIQPKLVDYAGHPLANHIVITVLATARDRGLVRNIIRSLLPHTPELLRSVVRRPKRDRRSDKLYFEPTDAHQPTPLVVNAMCAAAQRHAIVPLQERLVQTLAQFCVQAAQTTRYERALHHHFVKTKTTDEAPFRDAYTDDAPDVAADGVGGLFRGLLEFNQRLLNVKQALTRQLPPKESHFSLPGSTIVQTLLTFAAPHCDVVVQSMVAASADFLVLLARDQNSFIFDRVFASATVAPELKQQLVDKLLPSVVDLAQHNIGSRVVEACFAAADLDRKRAVASALAAQFETVRASKSGAFVLRNCRISASGELAPGWEQQHRKLEKTRRMFADIIGDAAPVASTAAAAANGAGDDDDDEASLMGQPAARPSHAERELKAQKKAEKKQRKAAAKEAAQEAEALEQATKADSKAARKADKAARKADKRRVADDPAGLDAELEQQLAAYDDVESVVPSKPSVATPAKWDASVLASIKPTFAAAQPVASAAAAVGDESKKRKAAPNARSRRRHKKMLLAGAAKSAAAVANDDNDDEASE
jgi:hypothetical protein